MKVFGYRLMVINFLDVVTVVSQIPINLMNITLPFMLRFGKKM